MVKLTVALLILRTFNIITQDEYDIINKRLKDIIRFATDYLGIKLYWYQAVILYMVELRLV